MTADTAIPFSLLKMLFTAIYSIEQLVKLAFVCSKCNFLSSRCCDHFFYEGSFPLLKVSGGEIFSAINVSATDQACVPVTCANA